jgi:hypothetical protein
MRLSAAVLVVAAGAVATLAPIVTGLGIRQAQAAGATLDHTVSGDHAWDPATNAPNPLPPTVTVDQTSDLTNQMVHIVWKNFTPSMDSSATPRHGYFPNDTYYSVTVLECRGTNPGDPNFDGPPDYGPDCYAHTPDDPNASDGVGNEVNTFTAADGTGEVYFHVETAVENRFLGCDPTHPCSLVVVPNWGGLESFGEGRDAPDVNCADHSADFSNVLGPWAIDIFSALACSWSDRFVIPLQFAQTPAQCPSAAPAFAAQGAPMLARTVSQWQAGWCNDPHGKLSFDFDSGVNEYRARESFLAGGSGALTSATDLAVVNRPPSPVDGQARKFTYAPVATSGIAIAYHIDDQSTGQLITDLTLNARLVAKLLTQSYWLFNYDCQQVADPTAQGPNCDPAMTGNPRSIFYDPEFLALNPKYTATDFLGIADALGQFQPLVVAGNSDLVYELTRWVVSDPDAAAFLAGKPDPWGMHVNTYYRGISYPLDQFQVLDPGYTAPRSADGTPGASTTQVTWNPISGLNLVTDSLVTDRSSGTDNTTLVCPDGGNRGPLCTYARLKSELPGQRGLFAIVGLNDAAANEFPTAKLVNAGGRAVAPDTAALTAAVNDMKTNPDKITQYADFSNPDPKQYPLTTVDYAMVPTCGLTSAKAAAISAFLDRVATSQRYGTDPGSLAPGNLALNSAQAAQLQAAQQAVSTQSCASAPPDTTISGSTPRDNVGSTGSARPGSQGGGPSVPAGGAPVTTASGAPSASGARAATPSASLAPAAFGVKHGDAGGPLGAWLPVLLGLGALLVAGGPATYLLATTGAGAALLSRVRRIRGGAPPSDPPVAADPVAADAVPQTPEHHR